MPVPLRLVFPDGTSAMIRVIVKGKEVVADLPVETAPARLELNPLESVLAQVKEAWKAAPPAK